MEKKKLIGTIIGIIFFIVLIAGATFAWLTFNATVTNGTYNVSSKEFVINYTNGTDIKSMPPIIGTPTSSNVTVKTILSAYKTSKTANGTFYIKLTSTTSNALTTNGVIKYAVCSGTSTTSNCTGNLTTGSTGVLSTGSVTGSTQTLYTTTTIPTSQTYYHVYLWIDEATFYNQTNYASYQNAQYGGYIHASATQNEN